MIIRILSEGQFALDDALVARLNALDNHLQVQLDRGDEAAFASVLTEMLHLVRTHGTIPAADELHASDAILPPADASLAEVRALIGEEGLIPD